MTTNVQHLSKQQCLELTKVTSAILAKGKGIIAADDALDDIGRKLKNVGLENTVENRRKYRELLITADKEMALYVSGIILTPETLYQKTSNGVRFVDVLNQKGIIPGVNVDGGLVDLPFTEDVATQGLDNLHVRCAEYKKEGARFAKWRVAYKITETTPSMLSIQENAKILARYASICQANGLVPIVEPDVSIEGNHDLERCQKVYEVVLSHVYKALVDYKVYLEGTLLKTAFVTPGLSVLKSKTMAQIGAATISTLQRTVPAAVPGIVFLSGGLSETDATLCLNSVTKEAATRLTIDKRGSKCPWTLTFCYGRALQFTAWKVWDGKDKNVKEAQEEVIKRSKTNSLASLGKY
ncbi:fructose-bisphosphate aldolase-like [Chrysoperla carnea]|uniref:fructose-bisphosphate aldolase-like n=1 Tax=Chrysoperla carnea TaxID=189513 RepID=UPI001D06DD1A|nr:fructose-bisphosphate aldolase-like [Chrysoperla carnea]